MLKEQICIIDCGTNTFNILVCEVDNGQYSVLHEGKVPVKIGKGIPQTGKFSEEAMQRAVTAMRSHYDVIQSINPRMQIVAVATAAFRNAANREEMRHRIKEACGISVTVISGDEEARLIAMGIRSLGIFGETPSLVMDIGGGSTEIILCTQHHIQAFRSFDTGASKLLDEFMPSDPIVTGEITAIETYLDTLMGDFMNALPATGIASMIGSSGFFDSVADMCYYHFPGMYTHKPLYTSIKAEHFEQLYGMLIPTIMEERLHFPGLAQFRAEMIVVSFILARYVYRRAKPEQLISARYSMKEGILYAWMHEKHNWTFIFNT